MNILLDRVENSLLAKMLAKPDGVVPTKPVKTVLDDLVMPEENENVDES